MKTIFTWALVAFSFQLFAQNEVNVRKKNEITLSGVNTFKEDDFVDYEIYGFGELGVIQCGIKKMGKNDYEFSFKALNQNFQVPKEASVPVEKGFGLGTEWVSYNDQINNRVVIVYQKIIKKESHVRVIVYDVAQRKITSDNEGVISPGVKKFKIQMIDNRVFLQADYDLKTKLGANLTVVNLYHGIVTKGIINWEQIPVKEPKGNLRSFQLTQDGKHIFLHYDIGTFSKNIGQAIMCLIDENGNYIIDNLEYVSDDKMYPRLLSFGKFNDNKKESFSIIAGLGPEQKAMNVTPHVDRIEYRFYDGENAIATKKYDLSKISGATRYVLSSKNIFGNSYYKFNLSPIGVFSHGENISWVVQGFTISSEYNFLTKKNTVYTNMVNYMIFNFDDEGDLNWNFGAPLSTKIEGYTPIPLVYPRLIGNYLYLVNQANNELYSVLISDEGKSEGSTFNIANLKKNKEMPVRDEVIILAKGSFLPMGRTGFIIKGGWDLSKQNKEQYESTRFLIKFEDNVFD